MDGIKASVSIKKSLADGITADKRTAGRRPADETSAGGPRNRQRGEDPPAPNLYHSLVTS